jgi:hypothetical protein
VELDVERLGRTLFCHGSPRSNDEAITAVTPEHRLQQLLGGVEARVRSRAGSPSRAPGAGAVLEGSEAPTPSGRPARRCGRRCRSVGSSSCEASDTPRWDTGTELFTAEVLSFLEAT